MIVITSTPRKIGTMTADEVNALDPGLYRIRWLNGSTSEGVVGALPSGAHAPRVFHDRYHRWLACSEWTSVDLTNIGRQMLYSWERVDRVEKLITQVAPTDTSPISPKEDDQWFATCLSTLDQLCVATLQRDWVAARALYDLMGEEFVQGGQQILPVRRINVPRHRLKIVARTDPRMPGNLDIDARSIVTSVEGWLDDPEGSPLVLNGMLLELYEMPDTPGEGEDDIGESQSVSSPKKEV